MNIGGIDLWFYVFQVRLVVAVITFRRTFMNITKEERKRREREKVKDKAKKTVRSRQTRERGEILTGLVLILSDLKSQKFNF